MQEQEPSKPQENANSVPKNFIKQESDSETFEYSKTPKIWMEQIRNLSGSAISVEAYLDAARFMKKWRVKNRYTQEEAAKILKIGDRTIKRIENIGKWPPYLRARVMENSDRATTSGLNKIAERKLSKSARERAVDRLIQGKPPFPIIRTDKKNSQREPCTDLECLALQEKLCRGLGTKRVRIERVNEGSFKIEIGPSNREYLESLLSILS